MLCVAVFLVSAGFRLSIGWFAPHPLVWAPLLLSQAGALAAGGWLALSYRGPEWLQVLRWAPTAGFMGLAAFLVVGVLSNDFQTTGRYMMTLGLPFATIFFSGLVALAITPGFIARFFRMAWLRWLGGISYGIYVFHILLIHLFSTAARHLAGNDWSMKYLLLRFLIAAVGSVAVAFFSYHLYEKQFLRLKKYFVPRTLVSVPSTASLPGRPSV